MTWIWILVFVSLFLYSGGLIQKRKTQYKWVGKCTCPNPDNHRPTCYAGMKWYEIGITVPQKYNYSDDEWYDPTLPFWKDEE